MSLPTSPCFVYYNGVTFPVETQTTGMKIAPHYDTAARAVTYIVYTITIKATLGAANQATSATTDDTLASLRKKLTAAAGEFHYEGVGLGQLSVNVPPAGPVAGGQATTARDVIWGPKPRVLEWKPMGQMAAEVVWTVDVAIPECDNARYAFALMEFCFKLTTSADRSGYTQRTYSGHLLIPQTRATADTRTLTDQADAYLERIYPPLIRGFRRVGGKTTLSEDKCRLDFEWTDEEMSRNVPPEGVVDVHASEVATTPQAIAGTQWTATFNATYEVQKDFHPSAALPHFVALVTDRMAVIAARLIPRRGRMIRGAVWPLTFTMVEPEIYGKKSAAFSMSFGLVSSLLGIVRDSGMWREVPGTGWDDWSRSNGAHKPRALAGLRVNNSVDAIIDLCLPANPQPPLAAGPPPPAQVVIPDDPLFQTTPPPEETSWIEFQCWIELEGDDETYGLKTLPDPQRSLGTEPLMRVTDSPLLRTTVTPPARTNAVLSSAVAGGDTTVQRRATPSRYVWLAGAAIRLGYPVTVPELDSLGGVPAIRANRLDRGEKAVHFIKGELFGVTVFAAWWRLRYLLPAYVAESPAPPHPYV